MKEFYYYQYSDDGGLTWFDGDCALTLMKCVDRCRRSCYKTRVLDHNNEVIAQEKVNRMIQHIETIEKIFK